MLSQFNESEIIQDFFGDFTGSFIDIGAATGVALSNTFELGLRGWRGMLVEASPIYFQSLVNNYVNRGYIELVNAALWHERRVMKFHLNGSWYSSLVEKEEANLYQGHYWVQTVTPADLFAIQPKADFISVDIEGADTIVFPELARHYPDCRLYCVEHGNADNVRALWHAIFDSFKLKIVGETAENYIVKKA